MVVRPPAVYGPGDRSTLPIFKGLSRGWLLHPAGAAARFSLIFASELADLVVALLAHPVRSGTIVEPDDGRPAAMAGPGWRASPSSESAQRVRGSACPSCP